MKKHEFNAKGMACPLPVVQTKKLLAEYDVVETTVDNFIATENLTKLAEQLNYDIDVKKISDEEYIVTISNSVTDKENSVKEVTEEKTQVIKAQDDSYIVVVNKQIMGHGSEELGKKLMKAFLYTLTEQEVLPKTIVFYNDGVFVTTEGSESLEDLSYLEEKGVELLICTTCLEYHKLTEKIAVGKASNGLIIAEKLMKASHVVKP